VQRLALQHSQEFGVEEKWESLNANGISIERTYEQIGNWTFKKTLKLRN